MVCVRFTTKNQIIRVTHSWIGNLFTLYVYFCLQPASTIQKKDFSCHCTWHDMTWHTWWNRAYLMFNMQLCQSMWAERTKYSRSAERVFIQRPEQSLCLAPVPLRYRSHHEPGACTNPPRIHLCLQQLSKLSAYTSKIVRCEGEIWSSWNISKSKPTGHTNAISRQFVHILRGG